MSTATTTVRPMTAQPVRAAAPAASGTSLGFAAIDPVRLLKRYYPWLIIAAVIGAVVGAGAHFILARTTPFFTSTATFMCKPQTTDPRFIGGNPMGQDDFTRFIFTQAAVMTSSRVLDRAVQDPDLERSRWAEPYKLRGALQPADAQVALKKALSARPRSNTNLIDLSLSYSDPDAAREVVHAVATAYIDEYKRDNNQESVARRQALNSQITNLDTQIRSLEESRARQMADLKVTDMKEGSAPEDVKTYRLQETLVGISRDLATTASLLSNYEQQLAESSVINYPEDMRSEAKRDQIVSQLELSIANMRTSERSLLTEGYGPEHPTMIGVRKRIEATQQELQDAEQRVLRKLFDAAVDRLRTQKNALQEQELKLAEELTEVKARKEDLTRLRVRLDQIGNDLLRLNAERTDLVNARNNIETILKEDVYSRVTMVQSAQRPTEMSFPQFRILVPLGVVLAVGLVGVGLLLREVLDQRVKGPADLAMIPRLRVLGMVPDAAEDPVKAANVETAFRDAPQGVVSESFRQLRAPLFKKMDTEGFKALLVLAGMPGSGATTVVCNVAIASAGAGDRVLVIDANLRRPAVHRVFGMQESPGLGDCLAGQAMLSDAIRPTTVPNLSILAAGSPANRLLPERLSSETMTRLLAEAASRYDRVIVDAPPAIVSGDGLSLANKCDAIALVVRAMGEKRGLVNRLRLQLSEVRGELLGVIVNAVRSSAGGYFKKNIQATHEYQSQSR